MRQELIQAIELVGREKGIDRATLIDAVGAAILSATRKTLGGAMDLKIRFDAQLGKFRLYSLKRVVEAPSNPRTEISLPAALEIKPDVSLGEQVEIEVAPQTFGRIAAQTAKQVIMQRVREAERDNIYLNFKAQEGGVISGIVQRVTRSSIVVDLGKAEGILPQKERLPNDEYQQRDPIRAYILDVRKSPKGAHIILSRTHPNFLVKLFAMEVPEINEGLVKIKTAARQPGERAKISVITKDGNVDPVGACVGFRGVRVQAIVRELQGEKIDIIPWKEDPAVYITHALAPAMVSEVTVDPKARVLHVVVADDQLSLAIGKGGRNARLAAKLVGWKVDIKSQSQIAREAERRKEWRLKQVHTLMSIPGVGEKTAERLIDAGFSSLEKIARSSAASLEGVKGIGAKTAEKLIASSQQVLNSEEKSEEKSEEVEGAS